MDLLLYIYTYFVLLAILYYMKFELITNNSIIYQVFIFWIYYI